MSSRLALGAMATALVLASPTLGHAQQSEAELLQRLDSLRPLVEAAEADFQAFEEGQREAGRRYAAERARVDTLRIGQLTIITPVDQAETARELFGGVWRDHFGSVLHSPELDKVVFKFQWSDDHVPIHIDGPVRLVQMRSRSERSAVEARIRNVISMSVTADLGQMQTNVGAWGPGNPLEPRPLTSAYRLVAMTESRASRACLGGDTHSCATAMGLGSESGVEQVEAWYTPEERQAIVARGWLLRSRTVGRPARECVEEDRVAACNQLLAETRADLAPFSPPVRETFVALALEAGGEGAWDRLIEDPEMEVVDALEYASMLSVEQLMSTWLERLIESRPDTYENLVPKSGLALLWSLFFAALALRSTRWRLG